MNFGPSAGFMSRMKQNLPGMINAVGSQYGGAASGASRLSGGIMNKRPGMPGAPNKTPGVMPSSQPFQNVNFGGQSPSPMAPPSTMGSPMGGMGMGGGMSSGFMNPGMAGQLWNNYNNQTMPGMGDQYPQQVPGLNRQVIY